MPCPAFEDLLRGYDELTPGERRNAGAHLAVCGDCREYLETLADLDRELVGLYEGLQPPPGFMTDRFAADIRSRASTYWQPHPPSAWPEVLDFCGGAAIVAIVGFLAIAAAARAGVAFKLPPYAGWYATVLAVAAVLTLTWKARSAISFRGR
jgi:hypothetical protein